MKKLLEFLKREWFQIIILIFPFILIIAIWDKLPARIPIHWNLHGKADSFADKITGVFLLPLINIGLYLFLLVLPRIDPRGKNYTLSKAVRIVLLLVTLFLTIMFCTDMLEVAGYAVNGFATTYYGLLILFGIMGNYIGIVRSNYFVGIRTPWTLEDPEIWKKTHRLAGRLWMVTSVVFIVLGLFVPSKMYGYLTMIFLAITAGYPIVYSYVLYRKFSYHNTKEI